jgi:hypothetical protein
MKQHWAQRFTGLFWLLCSALCFVASKYFIGNFYEEYEAIPPSTLTGLLMDGHPANIIYPIASVVLSDFYIRLYAWMPHIAWYDYFMAAYLILSAAVVFSTVHTVLKERLRFRYILLLNLAVFFLFFTEHILNWNFTRTSLVICTSAFVWLAAVWLPREYSHRRLIPLFFNTLLFTIGVMVRPESGQLIFILGAFFIFCNEGITKKAALGVTSLFIPVLLIAGSIFYDRHTSSEFYLQLEPVTEYQMALGNVRPLSEMKTAEDSMKYKALREGILNDPEHISYEFVKRIRGGKSIFRLDQQLFARAQYLLRENMGPYGHLVLLNLFLLVAAIALLRFGLMVYAQYFLFHAFFWGLLFAICYLLDMELRIFRPLLFFYSAAHVIFLYRHFNFSRPVPAWVKPMAAIALVLLVMFHFPLMRQQRSNYEKSLAETRPRYRALEHAAKGTMLVPDSYTYMIIFFNNFTPFQNPDFSAFNHLFLTDFEAVSLTPPYRAYLSKLCGCNSTNLGEFFDYLYKHKEEVTLAGNRQRWQLYQSYLNTVHHKNFTFKSVGFMPPGSTAFLQQADTIHLLKIY